jgi:glycogen operon protein
MVNQHRAILQKWVPIDCIEGFYVRPGMFDRPGANALGSGVSFTVYSVNATSCTLCLFKHRSAEPFARIKYPDNYKIGKVFSMFVFNIEIDEI